MNRSVLILLAVTAMVFTSCIPTRDLIYLQKKVPNDTINNVNPVVNKPYRLQTNDIVMITIKALDQKLVDMFKPTDRVQNAITDGSVYFDGFSVDDHGNIRIPILGELNVLGFTLDEVRQKIETKLLEEYFNREANIFVVVKLSGFRYTINGEVIGPGSKTLYQERVNIMEAIANAGDITTVGDRKHVVVIRQVPHGSEMHELDLTDVRVMQSPYYYLKPNDYIYVKPLPQKALGTGSTAIQSLTTLVTVLSLVTTTILLLTQ